MKDISLKRCKKIGKITLIFYTLIYYNKSIPTNETMKQTSNEGGRRRILTGDSEYVRLNVEVLKAIKKRAKSYCTENDMTLKDFVALAVESTLDELEGKTA